MQGWVVRRLPRSNTKSWKSQLSSLPQNGKQTSQDTRNPKRRRKPANNSNPFVLKERNYTSFIYEKHYHKHPHRHFRPVKKRSWKISHLCTHNGLLPILFLTFFGLFFSFNLSILLFLLHLWPLGFFSSIISSQNIKLKKIVIVVVFLNTNDQSTMLSHHFF